MFSSDNYSILTLFVHQPPLLCQIICPAASLQSYESFALSFGRTDKLVYLQVSLVVHMFLISTVL